ncbi:MAG: hypothetical protein Q9219_004085 [cf. Caloplaca sp. 3 TL-2023]
MATFWCTALIFLTCLSAIYAAPSATNLDPRAATSVNQTTCGGKQYVYEQIAGYGLVPSNARDSFGDTLGGFGSSIAIDGKSWRKSKDGTYTGTLYAIPDRGWNTQGTINYQNRVHIFTISFTPSSDPTTASPSSPNLQLTYKSTTLLTDSTGNPSTGLEADPTGGLELSNFPILPAATYTGNGFGQPGAGGHRVSIDAEGLVIAKDGSYWISDEYGPYIYHFSKRGKLLAAIQPPPAFLPRRNGSISFSADSPPIYDPDRPLIPADPESGRANNQGLEGLTASPDGKTLYALIQSALINDGGPDNPNRRQARLLQYDVSNPNKPRYEHEYVVTLPLYTDPTAKKSKQTKVAAQSEIHYLSPTQFLILSRDSGAGRGQDATTSQYRRIDVFDISAATDVKGSDNDATNGSIASDTGVLEGGITAATYCSFIDFNVNSELAKFGLHNGGAQDQGLLNEKWESIAVVPVDGKDGKDGEYFVFSVSDNDFVTQDGFMGTALLQGLLTKITRDDQPLVKYSAWVRSQTSLERLQHALGEHRDRVDCIAGGNLVGHISLADIIVLGFPPGELDSVFDTTDLVKALRDKTIVSLLAGVSYDRLANALGPNSPTGQGYHVLRVIPSIGAKINDSVTLIAETAEAGQEQQKVVAWIFDQLGQTQWLPESLMDEATALGAACNALIMITVDAIVDAGVAEGMPRPAAAYVATACLRSAAGLMLNGGMTPESLKEAMSVPRGITINALLKLEQGHARSAISDTVRHAVHYTKNM